MNRAMSRSVLFALLAAVIGASACTSLLGSFDVGTGGGGEGGATGGSTTTGGGGTTTSIDCATQECCAPEDCADPGTVCAVRTCEAGKCGTAPEAEGKVVTNDPAGDCKQIVCDGAGAEKEVPLDSDVMSDGKECTVDTCVDGSPVNTNIDSGTPCPTTASHYCDGAGACVECVDGAQCASQVCGVNGTCLSAACADNVQNGDETDVDCGGSCNGCDTAQDCTVATDCYNGICGADGTCAAPTCADGVQNGGDYLAQNGETDVDCGGPCGATCGPMKSCKGDGDCTGNQCSGSVCVPNCFDGVLNNTESDVDCGGTCGPCTPGQTCGTGADCASTFCADGVCCDAACDGECEACTAAIKGSGVDGACGPLAAGTDPENECDVTDPTTCGDSDGFCSGLALCNKHPSGTLCGDAPSCAAGVQTNQDTCSGTGVCSNNGTTPCGLYACGATTCNTMCSSDVDCAGTAYCSNGACAQKQITGAACAAANECGSGFCADGVCCASACAGTCAACNLAGSVGTCTFLASGADPGDSDCPGATSVCDGAGACKTTQGAACAMNGSCLSGNCADGVCCDTACTGLCQACTNAKTGGTTGTCASIPNASDPDNECSGATTCNGVGVCTTLPTGQPCGAGIECTNGFCIDGFCCNNACQNPCQACSLAKKGSGANGTCGAIAANTDPDNECPTECNGASACEFVNGTACTVNSQCQSGACADGFCCNTACSGVCQACSSAKNGLMNGSCGNVTNATDPDAECPGVTVCNGAGACTQLAQGTACTVNGECASGFCVDGFCCNGACTFTCTACSLAKTGSANGTCANVTNATDPDNECPGAANCNGIGQCGLLAQGAACTLNAECQSGACVDGFCCNNACGALCQACSNAKTGAANGTCSNVTVNTDPDNECATECNGAGACEAATGTACALASQCQSGFCVDGFCCGAVCSATCQACSLAKTGSANGTCGNVTNATDPDNECAGVTTCNGAGACTKLAQGAACTLGTECLSTFCVDGFCCSAACGATCQACSLAKTGSANGTCGNVTNATDPDNECAGVTTCNGAGACTKLAQGAACTLGTECLSTFCVDGFCCSAACGATCQACSLAKTGAANGTCSNVTVNTDPDNECATECNGAGACEAVAGTACTLASQCQSGFCVDGFCCNTACGATCQACSAAKTGGVNGTCANVTVGTDPDNECIAPTPNCAAGGVCGL